MWVTIKGNMIFNYEMTKKITRFEENHKVQKKLEECQRDTEAIKTEFQSFKIYAGMLESAPQVILQFSILLKKLYYEDFLDLFDPIIWLQISSSLISVILTTSGLIAEMPFLVGKETRVPFRDLYFTYGKIVPLMSFAVTPRLFSIAATFSFATLEDAPFYVISLNSKLSFSLLK